MTDAPLLTDPLVFPSLGSSPGDPSPGVVQQERRFSVLVTLFRADLWGTRAFTRILQEAMAADPDLNDFTSSGSTRRGE